MQILKNCDLNGVKFNPIIYETNYVWKTYTGGVQSLIINLISLAYLIYVLDVWRRGDILPKISKTENYAPFTEHTVQGDFVSIAHWQIPGAGMIDPFDPTNIIILPILFSQKADSLEIIEYKSLLQQKTNLSRFETTMVNLKNVTLVTNMNFDKSKPSPKEYHILFKPCTEIYLLEGQKCASQSTVEKFFKSQINYFVFEIQFNYVENFELKNIRKEHFVLVEQDSLVVSEVYLRKTYAKIDSGLLFESSESAEYLTDAIFQTQTAKSTSFLQVDPTPIYAWFTLRLDPVYFYQQVIHTKLGEVLAQVGSIVSVLMLSNHLLTLLNHKALEKYLVDMVIAQHQPFYKKIIAKKNWYGAATMIYLNSKQLDLHSYNEWHRRASELARQHLSLGFWLEGIGTLLREKGTSEFLRSYSDKFRMDWIQEQEELDIECKEKVPLKELPTCTREKQESHLSSN